MTHKEWLDNEYKLWIEALQESTVHNFKEHPMVRRMLSEVDGRLWKSKVELPEDVDNLMTIHHIGGRSDAGSFFRMIYWAQQVLKQNPKSIVEIGGGVGEFYAIIRALGYDGRYYIYDLPEVKEFQRKYLAEVYEQTGLDVSEGWYGDLFVCSFYAFGEFTDEVKQWYVENLINKCPHGLIVWNPHSGASPDFPTTVHNVTIEPTIEEGISKITW